MKRLLSFLQKTNAPYWIAALGLHGLLLWSPIVPSNEPPKEKPIRIVKLPEKPARIVLAQKRPARPIAPPKLKIPPRPTRQAIPQPVASPSPTPSPTPSPKVKPSPKPVAQPTDPLALFAKAEGAAPACKATKPDCWQVQETQWRSVAEDLEGRLQQQGYAVTKLDDLEDDTGMGIYQVSKDGKTNYLHLLLTDRGTVYMLNPKPLSRQELELEIGVS